MCFKYKIGSKFKRFWELSDGGERVEGGEF